MAPSDREIDILEVIDRMLSAALRELRSARARLPADAPPPRSTRDLRMSQTKAAEDILKSEGRPLHISALLGALETAGLHANRESLVSAITKKLAPLGPFVRTARNTFGLAGRDSAEEV